MYVCIRFVTRPWRQVCNPPERVCGPTSSKRVLETCTLYCVCLPLERSSRHAAGTSLGWSTTHPLTGSLLGPSRLCMQWLANSWQRWVCTDTQLPILQCIFKKVSIPRALPMVIKSFCYCYMYVSCQKLTKLPVANWKCLRTYTYV